jgi:CheY-like chemotaxis protein
MRSPTLEQPLPRILVVDDQPHVRASIEMVLQSKNFDVVLAESGCEGIKKFQESTFDLAIVDIYMPDMDGVKVIKAFRARNPNLPIVAISGVLLSASGRMTLDLLPTVPDLSNVICLKKPFVPSQLVQAIENAMGEVV